jgi:hypothetical protein
MLTKFEECKSKMETDAKAFFAMHLVLGMFDRMYAPLELLQTAEFNHWFERAEQLYDSLKQMDTDIDLTKHANAIGIALHSKSDQNIGKLISPTDCIILTKAFTAFKNASEKRRESLSDAYEDTLLAVYLRSGVFFNIKDAEGINFRVTNITKIFSLEDMLEIANQTIAKHKEEARVDANSASTSLSSGEVPNQGFLSSIVNLAYAIPGLLLSSLDRRDNSTPAPEQKR